MSCLVPLSRPSPSPRNHTHTHTHTHTYTHKHTYERTHTHTLARPRCLLPSPLIRGPPTPRVHALKAWSSSSSFRPLVRCMCADGMAADAEQRAKCTQEQRGQRGAAEAEKERERKDTEANALDLATRSEITLSQHCTNIVDCSFSFLPAPLLHPRAALCAQHANTLYYSRERVLVLNRQSREREPSAPGGGSD